MTEAFSGLPSPEEERWEPYGEVVTCRGDGLPVYLRTDPSGMLQVEFFRGVFKHYSAEQVTSLGDGDYHRGALIIGQQFVSNTSGAVNAPILTLQKMINLSAE